MNAPAQINARRRGACPGLSAPMPTGDGLLVRLTPNGTMALDAFAAFCAAAQDCGNGIIEITARGNIQVRGLTEASAQRFAALVAKLGIAADDGVPVLCNPLCGLDPDEAGDGSTLAAELRRALAGTSLAQALSPKISLIVDSRGALTLDRVPGDVRLVFREKTSPLIDVSVGGDSAQASALGTIMRRDAVAAVLRLLEIIASRDGRLRARDIVSAEGASIFRTAIADLLTGDKPSRRRLAAGEAIGAHRLRDGSFARGLGFAFGHADAASLQCLTAAAKTAGARGLRAGPDRMLLIVGIAQQAMAPLLATAKTLGFIVDAGDPRRHVVACAGAPICGAAHIAARQLGPQLAAAAAPYLDGTFTIHVSGCAKGCAHPSAAALTVVGTDAGCALVANGSARDTPFMTVAPRELAGTAAGLVRKIKGAQHV